MRLKFGTMSANSPLMISKNHNSLVRLVATRKVPPRPFSRVRSHIFVSHSKSALSVQARDRDIYLSPGLPTHRLAHAGINVKSERVDYALGGESLRGLSYCRDYRPICNEKWRLNGRSRPIGQWGTTGTRRPIKYHASPLSLMIVGKTAHVVR